MVGEGAATVQHCITRRDAVSPGRGNDRSPRVIPLLYVVAESLSRSSTPTPHHNTTTHDHHHHQQQTLVGSLLVCTCLTEQNWKVLIG